MPVSYTHLFRLRLFGKILLQIGVSVAATIAIMFLADGIFNNIIAETLSQIDRGFYLFLTSHKTGVVFVVFFTICVLTIASTLLKTTRYLSQIINSIDKVFQKDESLVELPDEFKDVEILSLIHISRAVHASPCPAFFPLRTQRRERFPE